MIQVTYLLDNEPLFSYTAETYPEKGKEVQLKGTAYKIEKVRVDLKKSTAEVSLSLVD